ncbi:ComF family protein [Staphylococcus debuckii]|uniref:ComF family protein n=1 Tax=Staphylococcus debuckii TaxID=2044912 RepID=UPI000F432E6D|nr:ComF family protein [Staphylococcus debuckii]AYU54575.1 ComF family protein [Staphylococcus debuckii]
MPKCCQCLQKFTDPLTADNFYRKPEILCETCREAWQQSLISREKKALESVGRCTRCLKPLAENETECLDCKFLAQRFTLINQLYCNYQYQGTVRDVIHQYKIAGDTALCEVIAEQISLPKKKYDYIVPIPSPLERDVKRTFNPVEQVLKAKKIAYMPLLNTQIRPKQSSLGKRERALAENPFCFSAMAQSLNLENKAILLVDDIYTTGLTVHHAAEILLVRKIGKVDVFTFAR